MSNPELPASGELRISLKGRNANDVGTVAEVLSAVNGLFRAVVEDVTGKPDAVRLELTGFSVVCDGCGCERPSDHEGWIHVDGDDFCPSCSASRGMETHG